MKSLFASVEPTVEAPVIICPRLCEYIILAEFDIDTGSTVRIQYPRKVDGYADDWFAENMLPEGVHNRVSDYTYMFLNRTSPIFGESVATSSATSGVSALTEDNADKDKQFLFGVNLVRTKYDSSVRRGAIVKAIAIFSRYSFVELFKKPLDLALEAYFLHQSPVIIEVSCNSSNEIASHELVLIIFVLACCAEFIQFIECCGYVVHPTAQTH
jgi:hypothetical protein